MTDEGQGWFERGNDRWTEGDGAGAEQAWRAASQAGHHHAALKLGDLLLAAGDFDGAASEWEFAAGAADPETAVTAILRYGRLISETEFRLDTAVGKARYAKSIGRDTSEADRLWRLGAGSTHEDAPWAYVGLGRLYDPTELAEDPDPDRSMEAFAQAAASSHPDAAPCAMLKLGRLRQSVGFQASREVPESALAVLRQGVDSLHPEWSPRCAMQLAQICANAGDRDQARRWWGIVAGAANPDMAEVADRALHDPSSFVYVGERKGGLRKLLGL